MASHYNGYGHAERMRRNRELKRARQRNGLPKAKPTGPCEICGDPKPPFDVHAEDCSWPYKPGGRVMCQICHRQKLHGRFAHPQNWQTYCAHVRRGGYGRDLKNPKVKMELRAYQAELKKGNRPPALQPIKGRIARRGGWWTKLTCDREILVRFDSRPRANADAKRALKMALANLSEQHLRLITAHFSMPDRTASIRDIAAAGGFPPAKAARMYRQAGEIICGYSEYDPPQTQAGRPDWLTIVAHRVKTDQAVNQWRLNDSFAKAAKSLGLVDN